MFQNLFRKPKPTQALPLAAVDPDERVYAIGDIHGRADLASALIDKLSDDLERFGDGRFGRFVFLGDYIDRGDQSRDVLELLMQLNAAAPGRCSFLAGNHEAAMLTFLDDPVAGADWIGWGGRQTLTSYGVAPPGRAPSERELRSTRDAFYPHIQPHLPFLQALETYTVSGSVVFAHASLDPELELDAQSEATLLWGRVRSGKPSGLPGHRLVHGHFDAITPDVTPGRICVDTGAYYSGRLTAVRLDAEEAFLHIDAGDLLP